MKIISLLESFAVIIICIVGLAWILQHKLNNSNAVSYTNNSTRYIPSGKSCDGNPYSCAINNYCSTGTVTATPTCTPMTPCSTAGAGTAVGCSATQYCFINQGQPGVCSPP